MAALQKSQGGHFILAKSSYTGRTFRKAVIHIQNISLN
jgi:hypothetical protein